MAHMIKASGASQTEIAKKLGVGTGSLSNFLKNGASAATMEEVADKLGYDLLDFLALGRSILEGTERPPVAPPAAAPPPPPVALAPEREMELLRQIAEMAATQGRLADQLYAADNRVEAKDKIISTTTEALRLKDIEIAEKREQLMAKDKIIQHLVGLLKGANLEHIIPPTLISLIRTSREKSLER